MVQSGLVHFTIKLTFSEQVVVQMGTMQLSLC